MGENEVNIKALYALLKEVYAKTDKIESSATSNTEQLKEEIKKLKAEIKQELEGLRTENEEIKRENQHLKTRLLVTERKLKKYNLVFYGLKEGESNIHDIKCIINLINDKLGIDCHSRDIRDCYRVGQKTQDKHRPITIEIVNYQLKLEIFKNTKNLKGTGIYIAKDYIPEDYEQQKILRRNLKIAREQNIEAYIKNNILIANGIKYTPEELKAQSIDTDIRRRQLNSAQYSSEILDVLTEKKAVETVETTTEAKKPSNKNSINCNENQNCLRPIAPEKASTSSPAYPEKGKGKGKLQRTDSISSYKSDRVTRKTTK